MAWAMKWLAPGTTSLRSPAGSAQLRWDSSAMVTACDHASVLDRRVRGETMVGANCLRAVTTSHTESPHRPLSARRRATSATARWPSTDWSRASRYRVVLRHRESAACGGMTDASHRIQASFMTATCSVAPSTPDGRAAQGSGHCDADGLACWGERRLSLALCCPGANPAGRGSCRFRRRRGGESARTVLPDFTTLPERGGAPALAPRGGMNGAGRAAAGSEPGGEARALVDRALGVELRGQFRTADHVALRMPPRQLPRERAFGHLPGADHHVVHGQHPRFAVQGDVQPGVVDLVVGHAAVH